MRDYLKKDAAKIVEADIEIVEGGEPDKEEDYTDIFNEDDLLAGEPDDYETDDDL